MEAEDDINQNLSSSLDLNDDDIVDQSPLEPENWGPLVWSFLASGVMTVRRLFTPELYQRFTLRTASSLRLTFSLSFFPFLCLGAIWRKNGFGLSHLVYPILAKVIFESLLGDDRQLTLPLISRDYYGLSNYPFHVFGTFHINGRFEISHLVKGYASRMGHSIADIQNLWMGTRSRGRYDQRCSRVDFVDILGDNVF